jgi:MFS family permease
MPEAHDPYAALRHRDYRLLLGGGFVAAVGSGIQTVAVQWELYERTHSTLALGLVGLVQFLPVLLLVLPAGHAADRFPRMRILVVAQLGLALAALGLAALSFADGPVPLIYLCLLLSGVCRAFYNPARWAAMSEVVPTAELANAVTWNSSAWQVATVAGPVLGGLLIMLTGRQAGWAYVAAALAILSCAGLLTRVRPRLVTRHAGELTVESLLAGIRFVWQTKLILATITLDLFAVLLGGATALLPAFAKDILEVGALELGLLQAAPALGAVVMGAVLAHRPPIRRAGRAMLAAVAGFGVATVVFGLSENFILSFAMLALSGALDNISVVVRGTLMLVLTPNAMRGRASAVNSLFIISSNYLGDFESGITAYYFGPVWSVVGGGVGSILVVAAVIWTWPEILRLGSLRDPQGIEEAKRLEADASVQTSTGS